MPKTIRHYCERFKYHWWGRFGAAGFVTLVLYSILDKLGFKMKNKYFPIHLRGLRYPFFARFGASDEWVFNQIFIEREYFPVTDIRNPKLIIDCGANVGYSALWFLNQYPEARIIVIEPDSENFNLCRKNLLPYGNRVSFVHAGVWPHETGLVVVRGAYKDGREWATQVRECHAGEKPDLYGVEINNLLKEPAAGSIDILKIDIEASEKNLFAENVEPWLGKVKNIVIELHGKECEEIFFKAMSFYDYDLSMSGELTLCKNISPKLESDKLSRRHPPPPLFSIIMAVHNGQTYVGKTIESVLAQTDPDWEFIIIDDFSRDQTPEILAAYASKDNRIRVLWNDQNIKVARSLNRGIQTAKGTWLVRLDADDVFTPHYLKTLRTYAAKAAWDCFFASWITVVDEAGIKILDVQLPKADTIRRMMKIENFLYHPATSFSKQLWENVGGYPEQEPAISEDTAMWNRFFAADAKLVMIPEFLVNYRLHYTNMTSVKDAKLLLEPRTSQDWKMIRQNREWRVSLYLKQKMLKPARMEILKIGRTQKFLSLKNIQYFLLTFLPESFVVYYMWEIRPRVRSFFKKLTGSIQTRGKTVEMSPL